MRRVLSFIFLFLVVVTSVIATTATAVEVGEYEPVRGSLSQSIHVYPRLSNRTYIRCFLPDGTLDYVQSYSVYSSNNATVIVNDKYSTFELCFVTVPSDGYNSIFCEDAPTYLYGQPCDFTPTGGLTDATMYITERLGFWSLWSVYGTTFRFSYVDLPTPTPVPTPTPTPTAAITYPYTVDDIPSDVALSGFADVPVVDDDSYSALSVLDDDNINGVIGLVAGEFWALFGGVFILIISLGFLAYLLWG